MQFRGPWNSSSGMAESSDRGAAGLAMAGSTHNPEPILGLRKPIPSRTQTQDEVIVISSDEGEPAVKPRLIAPTASKTRTNNPARSTDDSQATKDFALRIVNTPPLRNARPGKGYSPTLHSPKNPSSSPVEPPLMPGEVRSSNVHESTNASPKLKETPYRIGCSKSKRRRIVTSDAVTTPESLSSKGPLVTVATPAALHSGTPIKPDLSTPRTNDGSPKPLRSQKRHVHMSKTLGKSRLIRKPSAAQTPARNSHISPKQEKISPRQPGSKVETMAEAVLAACSLVDDSDTGDGVSGPRDMVRKRSALSFRRSSPASKTVESHVEATGGTIWQEIHVSSKAAKRLNHGNSASANVPGRTQKPLERLTRLRSLNRDSAAEMTPDSLTEGVSSPLTKLRLADVELKLKRHLMTFGDSHRAHMKSLLPRQRMAFELEQNLSRSQSNAKHMQKTSPFNFAKYQDTPASDQAPAIYPLSTKFERNMEQSTAPLMGLRPFKYACSGPDIPPYEYYHRLRSNVLVPNQKILLAVPHEDLLEHQPKSQDDLWTEFEEVYTDGLPDYGPLLLRCEKAKQYRHVFERLLDDISCTVEDVVSIYVRPENNVRTLAGVPTAARLQDMAAEENPQVSKTFEEWSGLSDHLPESTAEAREAAHLACAAFRKVLGFSAWPMVQSKAREALKGVRSARASNAVLQTHTSMACRTCHMYNCTKHGELRQRSDSCSSDEGQSALGWNFRHPMIGARSAKMASTLSDAETTPKSRPSNRRTPKSGSSRSGRRSPTSTPDVMIGATGPASPEVASSEAKSPPSYRCSKSCSLDRKALDAAPFTDVEVTLRRFSREERDLARSLLGAFGSSERCSCLVAMALKRPCTQVYHLLAMLGGLQRNSSLDEDEDLEQDWDWRKEKSMTDVSLRKIFYPCSHDGSCKDANCRCFREKVNCEKACACLPSCKRRYRGCHCKRVGRICWSNDDCDCFKLQRECDPDLCGRCAAAEVLDPQTRDTEGILVGRCGNVGIQRGRPKRLVLGSSQVSGFGLFAGETIREGEFLGEYTGEIMTKAEAHRRKIFYQQFPREYTFDLNADQELDGTHAGCKIRFINNSSVEANINCYQSHLLCNMQTRIGMFASKDIEPGDELFFDYGYPEDKVKNFREKKGTVIRVKTKKTVKKTQGTSADHSRVLNGVRESPDEMLSNVFNYGAVELDFEDDVMMQQILEHQGEDDEDYIADGEGVGFRVARSSSPEAVRRGGSSRKRKRRG